MFAQYAICNVRSFQYPCNQLRGRTSDSFNDTPIKQGSMNSKPAKLKGHSTQGC